MKMVNAREKHARARDGFPICDGGRMREGEKRKEERGTGKRVQNIQFQLVRKSYMAVACSSALQEDRGELSAGGVLARTIFDAKRGGRNGKGRGKWRGQKG